MLDRLNSSVYNNFKKEWLWTREFALFARLKNHTTVFTKARKEKMAMVNNAKFADWLLGENITKNVLISVLLNMKDGLREIQTKFSLIRELIITEIKKKFLKSSKNRGKRMVMPSLRLTKKETKRRFIAITMWQWPSNLAILKSLKHVIDVKFSVCHMPITTTIQSLWMLFGFVGNVMEKSIEQIYQRERLNLETRKGCDSPTHTTKGVETGRNDLSLFLQGNKSGSGIQQDVLSIKVLASLTICGFKTSDLPEFKGG